MYSKFIMTKKAPKAPTFGEVSGNTKKPPKKPKKEKKIREYAAVRWCFTLNNYTSAEYDAMLLFCKNYSKGSTHYIIGKEIGEDKKTPHLQGYIELEIKKRMTEMKGVNARIHWEKTKSNAKDNVIYCSKDGNFICGEAFAHFARKLKLLKTEQLYDWQKEILEIVQNPPDDRTIFWFWDKKGNLGKSAFSKYLAYYYGAIPVDGKKNDILYCCAEYESGTYIFDFERSMEDKIPYGAMEKIKNGLFMCGKYESKPIIRNSPHILCFANFKPDVSMLSKDRWRIKELRINSF